MSVLQLPLLTQGSTDFSSGLYYKTSLNYFYKALQAPTGICEDLH